jgi:hypothetical protein
MVILLCSADRADSGGLFRLGGTVIESSQFSEMRIPIVGPLLVFSQAGLRADKLSGIVLGQYKRRSATYADQAKPTGATLALLVALSCQPIA